MAKKIKVVEMNTSNPEAVVEQVQEADPTPMQEDIPQPESPKEPVIIPDSVLEEPKAKKPRQPRQPREPKPPKEQKLVRAPFNEGSVSPQGGKPRVKKVEDPPQSESDSIDTEEMVEVIKNHRAKKKQPTPPTPPFVEGSVPTPRKEGGTEPPQAKEEEQK